MASLKSYYWPGIISASGFYLKSFLAISIILLGKSRARLEILSKDAFYHGYFYIRTKIYVRNYFQPIVRKEIM